MTDEERFEETVRIWRAARIEYDGRPLHIVMGREWYMALLAHKSALTGEGLQAMVDGPKDRHPFKFRNMPIVYSDDPKASPHCEPV